ARRESEIGEVDDPPGRLAEIPHTVGDTGRDAQEARRAVAQHEPHAYAFRLRALADVDEDDEQAVPRRHVPDVGLAGVEMERLDRARGELAVVICRSVEPATAAVPPSPSRASSGSVPAPSGNPRR